MAKMPFPPKKAGKSGKQPAKGMQKFGKVAGKGGKSGTAAKSMTKIAK